MNPAVQTKSNDGVKFKDTEDNWKTTSGRQLGDNWNAIQKEVENKATGSRQLGVGVGWKTIGKESGEHIWNKIRDNWKTTFARQTRNLSPKGW